MNYEKAPNTSTFKKFIRNFGKPLLAFEIGLLGCSYLFWRRTNTDPEFRWYLHLNYPSVLEGYYRIGETISSQSRIIRETDLMTWGKINPKSE